MTRRLAAAMVAVAALLSVAVSPAPPAQAYKYKYPNHYFNTWEQGVIASIGIGYATSRIGCRANCQLVVTFAAAWVTRNGICSKRRDLKVTMIGVPLWARCVSGLPIRGGSTGSGGGGGGGGSWRTVAG